MICAAWESFMYWAVLAAVLTVYIVSLRSEMRQLKTLNGELEAENSRMFDEILTIKELETKK